MVAEASLMESLTAAGEVEVVVALGLIIDAKSATKARSNEFELSSVASSSDALQYARILMRGISVLFTLGRSLFTATMVSTLFSTTTASGLLIG